MIDIRVLRADADAVKAALARRGVEASEVDAILEADAAWSARVAQAEAMRAEVKDLSRQVGQARKAGDDALAAELSVRSRQLGEDESVASAEAAKTSLNLNRSVSMPREAPSTASPGNGTTRWVGSRTGWNADAGDRSLTRRRRRKPLS